MDTDVKRAALEAAVVNAMREASAVPMVWGRDDCALWCANILREALGYDGAARFRGRHRTRTGARRVLGRAGLAAALKASARKHRWRLIRAGEEMPGDIGVITIADVQATVICRARGWFVGRNETGFSALPAEAVRIIWAVV